MKSLLKKLNGEANLNGTKRTYFDSCVLIGIAKSRNKADDFFEIVDDKSRIFVSQYFFKIRASS